MTRPFTLICAALALFITAPVSADTALDNLARDLDRTESVRVPEFYQQDCVPCAVRPDLRLEAKGYQRPPDAREANKSP